MLNLRNVGAYIFWLDDLGDYQNGRNRSEQDQVSLIEEGQSYKGICRTGVKLNDTNEDIKQVKTTCSLN